MSKHKERLENTYKKCKSSFCNNNVHRKGKSPYCWICLKKMAACDGEPVKAPIEVPDDDGEFEELCSKMGREE